MGTAATGLGAVRLPPTSEKMGDSRDEWDKRVIPSPYPQLTGYYPYPSRYTIFYPYPTRFRWVWIWTVGMNTQRQDYLLAAASNFNFSMGERQIVS
jgi:hypothetical protein